MEVTSENNNEKINESVANDNQSNLSETPQESISVANNIETINNLQAQQTQSKDYFILKGKIINLLDILPLIFSSLLAIATIIIMAFDAVKIFGLNINIVSGITCILKIANFRFTNIYKPLVMFFSGFIYYGVLYINVSSLIKNLSYIFKNRKNIHAKETVIEHHCLDCIMCALRYVFFCIAISFFTGAEFDLTKKLFVAIMFIVFAVVSVMAFIRKICRENNNMIKFDYLVTILRHCAFLIGCYICLHFIMNLSAIEMFYNLKMLFGGYFQAEVVGVLNTVFETLVKPIFDIIFMFGWCAIVSNVFEGLKINYNMDKIFEKIKTKVKGFAICSVIVVLLAILLMLMLNGATAVSFDLIIKACGGLRLSYLPILISFSALYLISIGKPSDSK